MGPNWYALDGGALRTFKDGQQISRVLQADLPELRALEAGSDRLYVGDDTHWWSVTYADTATLIDANVNALDAKYMDGALYWVDTAQIVHFKREPNSTGVAYCVLPNAAFEVESVLLARIGPGAPAVFRRGYAEDILSDVVTCPAPSPGSIEEPVSGRLITEAGERTHAVAVAETFYWSDDDKLFRADAAGTKQELFAVPADGIVLGPFVVVGSTVVLSFEKDVTAGFFLIPLDSPGAPEVIGILRQPSALYVDEPAGRLCYADEYSFRVACLALSDLTAGVVAYDRRLSASRSRVELGLAQHSARR